MENKEPFQTQNMAVLATRTCSLLVSISQHKIWHLWFFFLRVWKGNERRLRKKKIFFKYFPFSNTVLVSSEMIDQKVIQKFIILLLNSAQHLILALGMWNRQEFLDFLSSKQGRLILIFVEEELTYF